MKKFFNALLIASLTLHVQSFSSGSFGKEPPLQNVSAVDNAVSSTDLVFEKRLFLSSDVIWSVSPSEGTIKALDSRRLSPKWSSSGIVYRVPKSFSTVCRIDNKRSDKKNNLTLFDDNIQFAEILGRVYFHLAEKNQSDIVLGQTSNSPSSAPYTDQILAFDPQSQGKLLWKLKANELSQIHSTSSKSVPYFAATPLKEKNNVLIVVLILDSRSICLKIDARSGKLILD